tara:strand:+ start:3765 stop:3947 length:183 start_codon:yes stop_codon:yes gene_type:complete
MAKNCWRYLGVCSEELYSDCSGKDNCELYQKLRKREGARKLERRQLRLERKMYMILNCVD